MAISSNKGATKKRRQVSFGKLMAAAVKGMAIAIIASVSFFIISSLSAIQWKPMAVRIVELEQALVYQNRDKVTEVTNKYVGKSMLTLSLADMKQEIEDLPWVYQAQIAKNWPAVIRVEIEEHEPVAIWNDQKVLNSDGVPLEKPVSEMELTRLIGPDGRAEIVMSQYLQFNQVFAQQMLQLEHVTMRPRGAWTIELVSGVTIALGDKRVLERSRRVIEVLLTEGFEEEKIEYIDARYPNGVAVRFKADMNTEVENDISA